LVGHEWTNGPVDGNVAKVDTKTRDLSVLVREVASSEQWVIGKVHSRDNVLRAEGDLFDFSEVVGRVGVESKGTNVLDGDKVFRNDLK